MERKEGKPPASGTEKVLIAIIAGLAALIVLAWMLLGKLLFSEPVPEENLPTSTPALNTLATPEDRLPRNLAVGQKPPEGSFQDEDGGWINVQELISPEDQGVWLVFWASWCPDCDQQFEILGEMDAMAKASGVRLVLVDRLNPEKESREAARLKWTANGAKGMLVYDPEETVYRAWGLREIPTSVALDRGGAVAGYAAGTLNAGECQGLLKRMTEGRDRVGLAFIRERLSDSEGGVFTSTAEHDETPSGRDVLSESQGLMMQYALMRNDRELFDRTWTFVRDRMLRGGLIAWTVHGGEAAAVNATLDDLRILDALRDAAEKWEGDYAAYAEEIAGALLEKCVNSSGGLADFAETAGPGQAETISLSYLAPDILRRLAAENEGYRAVAERAEEILRQGRISDEFPLYYSRYDYRTGEYSRDDLNMAEALYTLWNLSRADALPGDAWAWLRQRIETGELAARYHTDGTIVSGYAYHATAVWGLAALIAWEEADEAVFELALRRMDRMCVTDAEDPEFGAYAQKGAEIYAFDQLIPLTVNALAEEKGSGER